MKESDTRQVLYRRIKKKKDNKKRANRRLTLFWLSLCMVVVLFIISLNFAMAGTYSLLTNDLPSIENLPTLFDPDDGSLLQPTQIYDHTGQKVLDSIEIEGIPREFLSINPENKNSFSPQLIQVTIAILEPDYWESSGISWWNLFSNSPHTIAERFVNQTLLENEAPGLFHAIRMRILAAQVVSEYGKSNLLEWYLNSTYYGHLAYGAQSASLLYLDKSAADLDLKEACLLTMINITPTLNPIDSPVAAKEIKQAALDKLYENNIISSQDYQNASNEEIAFNPDADKKRTSSNTITNLVLEQLAGSFGEHTIERGGLKIITSIDQDLQEQMNCVINTQLSRLAGNGNNTALDISDSCSAVRFLPSLSPEYYNLASDIKASAIIIDLETSQVLAVVGDADLNGDSGILASRQPGTMLSPMIAAISFSRGMSPASLVWDIPDDMLEDSTLAAYLPSVYHGPQRLRMAVANNYAPAFHEIINQIGSNNLKRLIEPFGITIPATESIEDELYHGGSVNILEMAQAYSVFANLGVQRGIVSDENGNNMLPQIVLNVLDISGNNLYAAAETKEKQVLSAELSYLVHHILADDTARSPSLGYPNSLEISRPSAGKAGFSDNKQEIWTVGYTPQLIASTWLGESSSLKENGGQTLDEEISAGMWYALMQYASQDLPAEDWERPVAVSVVTVCNPSGMLPTNDCPSTVSEVFTSGNEPTESDTLYSTYTINKETGLLATVFTPLELVEERSFMNVPQNAEAWAISSGINLPPTKYDSINPPLASEEVNITSPAMYSYVNGTVDIIGSATGDNFESYTLQIGQGLNPQAWLQVNEQDGITVSNNKLGTWETTQDGLYAIRLIVLRDENNIESDIVQVTVDNTPPTVSISYPDNEQTISIRSSEKMSISVTAEDSIGIQSVELYLDNVLLDRKEISPFIFLWTPKKGDHSLYAKAYDLAGNSTESEIITFSVN